MSAELASARYALSPFDAGHVLSHDRRCLYHVHYAPDGTPTFVHGEKKAARWRTLGDDEDLHWTVAAPSMEAPWEGDARGVKYQDCSPNSTVVPVPISARTALRARGLYVVAFERHEPRPAVSATTVCSTLTGPVWSRGIARSCCDVHPTSFFIRGSSAHGGVEVGDLNYTTTALTTALVSRVPPTFRQQYANALDGVVYVPSMQLPQFVSALRQLPPSARITLVTGQEDVGVPREAWRLSPSPGWRDTFSAMPPARKLAAAIGRMPAPLEEVHPYHTHPYNPPIQPTHAAHPCHPGAPRRAARPLVCTELRPHW